MVPENESNDEIDVTGFPGQLDAGQVALAQMIATVTAALLVNAKETPKGLNARVALITEANKIVFTILHVVSSFSNNANSTPDQGGG